MGDAPSRPIPPLKPAAEALPRVLARARRLAPASAEGSVVADLLAGIGANEIAAQRGLPLARVEGIRTFYDQIEAVPRACDGTACRFNGGDQLRERLESLAPVGSVRCLGHCYAAPAFQSGGSVFTRSRDDEPERWISAWGEGQVPARDLAPIPRRSLAPEPVVLRDLLGQSTDPLDEYELPDGATILDAVEVARIHGRGGALYPTAAKWRSARDTDAGDRVVVANGDEGDPGSFVDRLLLEEKPHAILAGMMACARAIDSRRGYVYIRREYPLAHQKMRLAIAEARALGALDPGFEVEVVSGAGSYLCGEETALLQSIEGLRGEPRLKPPYPSERGLFGLPTVVQNVETLALIPWAVRHARPPGTKVVSLSGALRWTGAVEIPIGMPLRRVLHEAGGGPPRERAWKLALIGGPMGRVLPERQFDTPLSWEALPGMGHAGIVVLDESTHPRALAEHLFEFARAESCGQCTPCRAGTAQLAGVRERAVLERLLTTMEQGSLCGFGLGVPRPIRDLLEHFGDEVLA
jgi:NADH:ubiquinone oxidoreductase subunit F (NADH-binding)